MAAVTLTGANLGGRLSELMDADDIEPGSTPSYQLCKNLYAYHPLGLKLAEAPIALAMSQKRAISVPGSPEEMVVDAFTREWQALGMDKIIYTLKSMSRVYGVASVAILIDGLLPDAPMPFKELHKKQLAFNVLDPLNTAGSLVLNQDPNALDFQKVVSVGVSGKSYHRTRTIVVMNESPLYIEYTTSAFGYVGRSVYQRALYPLKSFLSTMVTDDMVSRKAGVLVAMIKQAGSIADALMRKVTGFKRALLQEAETDNVISIGQDDKVESLNLLNIDGAMTTSRTNILKNIATSADMPAVLVENETLTEGFGEGTEDAKTIAKYVDRMREDMRPIYSFFDEIVMYRAWNEEFYETIKAAHPEQYDGIAYTTAFYQWKSRFTYEWPSLLIEPESEEIKVEETKYKAIIGLLESLAPLVPDQENKALLVEWAQANFNENKRLFPNPLNLDTDSIASYEAPAAPGAGAGADAKEPKPEELKGLD